MMQTRRTITGRRPTRDHDVCLAALGGRCPPNPLGFIALKSKAAQGASDDIEDRNAFIQKARGVSGETPPCSFGRSDGAQVASQQSLILRLNNRILQLPNNRHQNELTNK